MVAERENMAIVLKGTEVAQALNDKILVEVEKLRAKGVVPTLATVRVGERADDIAYERAAVTSAKKAGVEVRNVVVPETISQEDLIEQIELLNADSAVHGILLFSPLPEHLDEKVVCEALAVVKDIDGITKLSHAGVFTDSPTGYAPCTPSACLEILDHYGIEISGKHAVVIGRSLVVGKPVAMMLLQRNATVTICHSRTVDLPAVTRSADLVIACVGRAKMINEQYLSENQTVIDVGINVSEDGRIVGDVDFEAASAKVAAITPVPGGVGAVTTKVLLKHVVEVAKAVSNL